MKKFSNQKIIQCISRQEQELALKVFHSESMEKDILEKKNTMAPPEYKRFIIQLFFNGVAHPTGNHQKLKELWSLLGNDLTDFFKEALSNAVLPEDISQINSKLDATVLSRWMQEDALYKIPYPPQLARLVIDSILALRIKASKERLLSDKHLEWFLLTSPSNNEISASIEKVFHSRINTFIKHLLHLKIEDKLAVDWYLLQPNANQTQGWKKQTVKRIDIVMDCQCNEAINHLGKPLFSDGTLSPLAFLVMENDTLEDKEAECVAILKDKYLNNMTKIAFFKEISALLPKEVTASLKKSFPLLLSKKRQAQLGFFEQNEPKIVKHDASQEDIATHETSEREVPEAEQNRVVIVLLQFIYEQIKDIALIGYFSENLAAFHLLMNNPDMLYALENTREDQNIIDIIMSNQLKEILEWVIPVFDVRQLFTENYNGEVTPEEYVEVCRERLLQITQLLETQTQGFQP
ncbi:MAG: hypothetical protein WC785_00855 [Tatlockia sp.]